MDPSVVYFQQYLYLCVTVSVVLMWSMVCVSVGFSQLNGFLCVCVSLPPTRRPCGSCPTSQQATSSRCRPSSTLACCPWSSTSWLRWVAEPLCSPTKHYVAPMSLWRSVRNTTLTTDNLSLCLSAGRLWHTEGGSLGHQQLDNKWKKRSGMFYQGCLHQYPIHTALRCVWSWLAG